MAKKLLVSGLSWDVTDETLREAFLPFGEIGHAAVVVDRETGRSRGYGFVTMSASDDARAAIDALHGTNLDGRTIRVTEAQERSGVRRRGQTTRF